MNEKYKIVKKGSKYELFDKDSKSLGVFYYTNLSLSYLSREAKIIVKNSSYTIKSKDYLTTKDKILLPKVSWRVLTTLLNEKTNIEHGTLLWTSFFNIIKTCEFKKLDNTKYKTLEYKVPELLTQEWVDQKGKNVAKLKITNGFLKTKEVQVETNLDLSDEENVAFIFWAFYRVFKIEYISWIMLIILILFLIPLLLQFLFNIT